MTYKVLAALFLVLNIQGLQTKSVLPPSITACTLDEAVEIKNKHVEDISVHVDNVLAANAEEVSQANDNLMILINESTENNQKVIDDLQAVLNDARVATENDLSSTICMAALQFHIDALSDHGKTRFDKCVLHSQKKQLDLVSKQASVQEKANSIILKASVSLGKYAVDKHSVMECTDLDFHLEAQSVSLSKKIDSLTDKISKSVADLSEDYQTCYYKTVLSTYPYVAFIKQQMSVCIPPTPEPSTEDPELGHAGESSTSEQETVTDADESVTSDESNTSQSSKQTDGPVESEQTTTEELPESTENTAEENQPGDVQVPHESSEEKHQSNENTEVENSSETVQVPHESNEEVHQSNENTEVENSSETVQVPHESNEEVHQSNENTEAENSSENPKESSETGPVSQENVENSLPSENPESASAELNQSNVEENSAVSHEVDETEVDQELDTTTQQNQRSDEEVEQSQDVDQNTAQENEDEAVEQE